VTPSKNTLGFVFVGAIAVISIVFPVSSWWVDGVHLAHLGLVGWSVFHVLRATSRHELGMLPTVLIATSALRIALDIAFARQCIAGNEVSWLASTLGTWTTHTSVVATLTALVFLAVVQLVVIARGAERTAEVSARFALDAMPGIQLAIDADLRAGNLDAESARRARQEALGDSQLAGALDGASRFVKGDAIAGILAMTVHVVGTTVAQYGNGDIVSTLSHAATLAAGEASLTRVPAFVMAVVAATAMTRTTWKRSQPSHTPWTLEAPTLERALLLSDVATKTLASLGIEAPVRAVQNDNGCVLCFRGSTVARFETDISDVESSVQQAMRAHAWMSLGLQEVRFMLDALSMESPVVARTLHGRADIDLMCEVLQRLVREGVALVPQRDVFEALARSLADEKDVVRITERVRSALRVHRTQQLAPDGQLTAFVIAPTVENDLVDHAARHPGTAPMGSLAVDLVAAIRAAGAEHSQVLTSPSARWYLHAAVRDVLPHVTALSRNELDPSVKIVVQGTITPQ
jgi:type III secretory pathway component EscV